MNDTHYVVTVICTDRGQHGLTQLGDLTRLPDGTWAANVSHDYGPIADRQVDSCVWLNGSGDQDDPMFRVHLRCPRCRRHEQWAGSRARERLDLLQAAGVKQLDVSLIP